MWGKGGLADLKAANDFPQGQDALVAPDEGGGGESERLVQVGLLQSIESWDGEGGGKSKSRVGQESWR